MGKGKFGVVRLGIHKTSGERVAIKIIKKSAIKEKDLALVRYEIETLKMCQHPNIMKLLDVFETFEYLYLVIELLEGGDLFSYLERVNFKVPEAKARKFIHSLATGLFYLHTYGIVHRDLKPENIMLKDKTENSDIKLVDFGLAKIIGPSETCTETYGTLAYIAPEVLMSKPYGKAVDIWSLGVIAHLLLVGFLPFDHKNDTVLSKYLLRERVRMTVKADLKYDSPKWEGVSEEGKNFVQSKAWKHLGILVKEPEKRMEIKELLQHPWILKGTKGMKKVRQNSVGGEVFAAFSLTDSDVE